jgi:hypothetical protein
LSPRGEFCSLEVKFSVHPSIFLNSRERSPLGVNEGVNIPPRGPISPLGAKFPLGARGEVKNGPQGVPKFYLLLDQDKLAEILSTNAQKFFRKLCMINV